MPIYEYECEKCGANFEMMQAISAKSIATCVKEKCGGKARRQVSVSGFVLKGSGWYTSDYPSEARKKGWQQESCQASGGNPNTGCAAGTGACAQEAVAPAGDSKPKGKPLKKAAKKTKA